jgi:hypothetical protein
VPINGKGVLMLPAVLFVYGAGLAVTALVVFRNRVFSRGYFLNAGSAVLWPVYWGFFLAAFLLNRKKRGAK